MSRDSIPKHFVTPEIPSLHGGKKGLKNTFYFSWRFKTFFSKKTRFLWVCEFGKPWVCGQRTFWCSPCFFQLFFKNTTMAKWASVNNAMSLSNCHWKFSKRIKEQSPRLRRMNKFNGGEKFYFILFSCTLGSRYIPRVGPFGVFYFSNRGFYSILP